MKLHSFRRIIALLLLLSLTLTGCQSASSIQTDFHSFLNDIFVSEVQSDSLTLNYTLSNPEKYGIDNFTPTLGIFSLEEMKRQAAVFENYLSRLKDFPYSKLSKDQQKTYDVLVSYLETALSGADYLLYEEALGPTTGIQAQLPILLSEYNFYHKDDIENYLSLLACVPDYFKQIIDFEQEKAAAGLFMSDTTADAIIKQCQGFLSDPENNAIIEVFNERVATLSFLSNKEKASYKKRNREQVINSVLPAYEHLVQGLSALKGSGKNEGGLCGFPKGRQYYTYLARYFTGSEKSIDEMSQALQEAITQRMKAIQSMAAKDSSLIEEALNASYPYTDPKKVLTYLQTAILADYPALSGDGTEAASNDAVYEVKYVPSSLEKNLSPAFYLTPPLDDSRANCIYINGYKKYDLSEIFTTLAHEGFPGHLYQTVYYNSLNPEPVREVLNFPGYSEGYATYAEYSSYYMTGWREEVARVLEYNQSATLFIYAMIDIGINYNGWNFAETTDYLADYGITNESSIRSVYNAMIEEPGTYLKYAVGCLEFQELQAYAKETLEDDYSLKAFNTFLLQMGPCSFDVMKKYMKQELLK